jgi:fucose 4-O-acetylase-like acetyltransferase
MSKADRKGSARFVLDRILRLGIPLIIYGFLIGPVTIALAKAENFQSFGEILGNLLAIGTFNWGPLWFAQALLIFTIGFVSWKWVAGSGPLQAALTPIPGHFA